MECSFVGVGGLYETTVAMASLSLCGARSRQLAVDEAVQARGVIAPTSGAEFPIGARVQGLGVGAAPVVARTVPGFWAGPSLTSGMLSNLLRAFCLLLLPVVAAAQSSVVRTDQVRAELVAHAPEGVAPGKTVWLGLLIEHQPHWHTYWKNPGDSGLPTRLEWKLPAGLAAGEIDWPRPYRMPVGPLVNYGFEGRLLLPVPVTVSAAPLGANLDIALRADWLVCKEVCIPESGEFKLKLPVQAATAGHGALFEDALARRPAALAGAKTEARIDGNAIALRVGGLPPAWRGQALDYFAADAGVIEHAAKPEQRWDGDQLVMRVPLSPQRSESPVTLQAVLAAPGDRAGVQIGFGLAGGWPAAAAGAGPATGADPGAPAGGVDATTAGSTAGTGSAAGTAGTTAAATTSAAPDAGNIGATPVSLRMAFILAFAGGVLLNLMPCVFPVLSLKVLGFASHAHQRRSLVAGGLAYSAGVIASFVGLAALMLGLRAAGAGLGWGFQLQSPPFVAALAVLFMLIGLNLAGLFEFGKFAPNSACTAHLKRPIGDHALTGVLAVLIASPCTAPFMGGALGMALTQPTPQALAIFAMLGAGMAAPYLVLACWPRAARWLPRPGAWMVRFKALMAFPMFATVIYLVWVIGQQAGIDGAAALLALLLVIAFAAWVHGTTVGRRGRWAWRGGAALLSLGFLAWAWPLLTHEVSGDAAAATTASRAPAGAVQWEPWSVERVEQARAEGRPVFVDFTAAWCVTCQFNKRVTLSRQEVQADFASKGVLLLRADWTRRDERITQELNRLGRSGVPVYALYGPGQAQPRILSEILSVAQVREAIAGWPAAVALPAQAVPDRAGEQLAAAAPGAPVTAPRSTP
jgi:thiol:disulfide interchange protein/DsbC/DsbD-like thiol-disulfide interchange protein